MQLAYPLKLWITQVCIVVGQIRNSPVFCGYSRFDDNSRPVKMIHGKRNWKRTMLRKTLILLAGLMIAEQAVAGDAYVQAATTIYGAYHGIALTKIICDQRFPLIRIASDAAMDAWKSRNQAIYNRVEADLLRHIQKNAKSQADVIHAAQHLAMIKAMFRDKLLAGSQLSTYCSEFPRYLNSGAMELAKRYHPQLVTMFGRSALK
jgi:hypothetical protein